MGKAVKWWRRGEMARVGAGRTAAPFSGVYMYRWDLGTRLQRAGGARRRLALFCNFSTSHIALENSVDKSLTLLHISSVGCSL